MKWDEYLWSKEGVPVVFAKHLLSFFGCRISIHKFVGSDDDECFHSHPAWAIRVILKGSYVEEIYPKAGIGIGRLKHIVPFTASIVAPDFIHRTEAVLDGPTYTLWLRGPKITEIQLYGTGWEDNDDDDDDA